MDKDQVREVIAKRSSRIKRRRRGKLGNRTANDGTELLAQKRTRDPTIRKRIIRYGSETGRR